MVFSSAIFLLCFLPLTVIGYHLCARFFPSHRAKNLWLLGASLLFYSWGETFYILLLLITIVVNWGFGIAIARGTSRILLALAVAVNLALLAHFKYADFLVDNLNRLAGSELLSNPAVHLPLGVSFFIFQAISYVVDVYRQHAQAQRQLLTVALYIALFPQLVAGPIVRYASIAKQLGERHVNAQQLADGIRRFIVGLAKKVLIANVVGEYADSIFATDPTTLTMAAAWLGIICYSLQIYFDFSGYSDMAIGLGAMFGFSFPENFRHPYIARSIREFWRRWHISLSSWFRDYLYIPLGGSRHGNLRTSLNLFTVFILCGLWHGASWNFVLWGAFHGFFLSIERLLARSHQTTAPNSQVSMFRGACLHLYTLLVIMFGWVLFRTETIAQAQGFYAAMLGFNELSVNAGVLTQTANSKILIATLLGLVFSTPIIHYFRSRATLMDAGGVRALLIDPLLIGLLLLSIMMIAAGTYNPFIYFRF